MKFSYFANRASEEHLDARARHPDPGKWQEAVGRLRRRRMLVGASLAAALATAAHAEAPTEADTPEAAMTGLLQRLRRFSRS